MARAVRLSRTDLIAPAVTDTFYDELAPFYHLLYPDWAQSVDRQGAALAGLLRDLGTPAGSRVHDAACGIGTQTIGLAVRGYQMSASDVSSAALARASEELASRQLTATLGVADMRALDTVVTDAVRAVIACDNAVPHLLSDDDICAAFRSARDILKPDGLLVISVRDYAMMLRRNPDVHPHAFHRDEDVRSMAVQVWEWDGDWYDVRLYLTREEADGSCATRVLRTRYYAVTIARLLELMRGAGFSRVERHDDVLFQPVLVGVR
ncbi:MAG: class I SAM-dependent methyltransferase [bacterium]